VRALIPRLVLPLLVLAGSPGTLAQPPQQSTVTTEVVEPTAITPGRAPRVGEYSPGFDALHYDLEVTVPPRGTTIEGSTGIELAAASSAPDAVVLDFTGLSVTSVKVNGATSRFGHDAGKLTIPLPREGRGRNRRLRIDIDYRGTPDDGLVIRSNVHGERAVFADNWPNRARFWFPSLDYPADKATATFTVVVPSGWEVIANGIRSAVPSEITAADGAAQRRFRWSIAQPISTYNMVFGAANFRVDTVGRACFEARCVDVTTWVFPESAAAAAPSFRRAPAMVEYFSQLIAPFPYAKLAHVQSATRFGGMENATAIFYDEKPLAAGRNIESTVAHETAHQWFGDAVTETDWRDLWLSEGFATYFSALFFEHADGAAAFRRIMDESRRSVVTAARNDTPIVDAEEQDLFRLLDSNRYAKGAWVLHMLRGMLGDARFFDGIRRYYRAHVNGTASTRDLQQAMEAASGLKLDDIFAEWLFRPGFPRLRLSSQWNAAQHTATVVVEQVQPPAWPTFTMPLTLELTTAAGPVRRRLDMNERLERISVPLDAPPLGVVADPDGWLLKDVESR
jgi:aminopeptidase N